MAQPLSQIASESHQQSQDQFLFKSIYEGHPLGMKRDSAQTSMSCFNNNHTMKPKVQASLIEKFNHRKSSMARGDQSSLSHTTSINQSTIDCRQ